MPSAEETTYLFEVMPDAGISQDNFAARDVDVLVSRIKQNLRLSGLKSRSSLAQTMRPSPYRLRDAQQQQHHNHNQKKKHPEHSTTFNRRCVKAALDLDDSYECFQALLRKGALIKEAVKRLQTSPEDYDDEEVEQVEEDVDEVDDDDDDDVEEVEVMSKRRLTSTTLDSMDDDEED